MKQIEEAKLEEIALANGDDSADNCKVESGGRKGYRRGASVFDTTLMHNKMDLHTHSTPGSSGGLYLHIEDAPHKQRNEHRVDEHTSNDIQLNVNTRNCRS